MKRAWILAFVAASAVPGCARGGGDRLPDAGNTTMNMDAGPGVGFLDSGPGGGFDAGPGGGGFDAGPGGGGFDAGPGGGFDAGPGGGGCSETPCKLVSPQCGCPAGQGCYLGSGSTRICGTAGPEVEGQACSGETSCQPGMLCIGASAGNTYCSRFCNTDTDCTGGAGSICLIELNDGAGGSIPGVTLCTAHCSPVTSTGCPSGMACGLGQEETGAMRWFTGCIEAGSVTAGGACTDVECAPGHVCIGGFCERWCRVGSTGDCGGLEVCTGFTDAPSVGGVEYGVCQ